MSSALKVQSDSQNPLSRASKKARKRRVILPFTPETPPKIVDGHVQEIRGGFRGRYRQTKSDPLRNYADAGQIDEVQFQAGKWYEERYALRFASGKDSTDLDRISGGTSSAPWSQRQADAIRQIIAVDSRLSSANRAIIRAICGEGHTASHVVRMVTGETERKFPIPRFREALGKLQEAISLAQRSGWTFSIVADG